MKILIGKLGLETNTFAEEEGTFERWAQMGCPVGQDMIATYYGKGDYTSGMMRAADELNVEIAPTLAMLDAGPLMKKEAVDHVFNILDTILSDNIGKVDGVCFALHGAGCTEICDDLESYTLKAIRAKLGSDIPITITLDLHANMSYEMVSLCQGVFGIKEYPHVDIEQAGYLAMKSLVELIRDKKPLYTGLVRLPMLIPAAIGGTFEMPMKGFADFVKEYKDEHDLVDATFFHGFPYIDRPVLGSSVVTVSNRGQEDADNCAEEIAAWVWENREKLNVHIPDAEEALDIAEKYLSENPSARGYVLINEPGDNPGGACPGDGTILLRAVLERNSRRTILGHFHDAEMIEKAFSAGVGGYISGEFGAKTDTMHGTPVYLKDAYVCALSDGKIRYNTPVLFDQFANYGRAARLRVGNTEIVVTEVQSQQTFDNMPFVMVGADIDQYEIVCVKSAIHFKAYFKEKAKLIVPADAPGTHGANLLKIPYTNINRPLFPIDKDCEREI